MRTFTASIFFLFTFIVMSSNLSSKEKILTNEEKRIIINKGTEAPFTGKYYSHKAEGVYTCRQCGQILYISSDKFDSGCGWPSFDDEVSGAVKRLPDADGKRTEIVCSRCNGHLGHVFIGEKLTPKNTRHCVNSISLDFIPTQTAIFAGGCFWGVEHLMQKMKGVLLVESGYIGGNTENPTYEDVCKRITGHAEAVRVIFNPLETTFDKLTRYFFEIHDPEQLNRQGPDVGEQYRSEIFYTNVEQQTTALKLIELLKTKGYHPTTQVTQAGVFWKAEDYHQNYYTKKASQPYCHFYKKRF